MYSFSFFLYSSLISFSFFFFFNDTATTEIYTLSLHDALPTCDRVAAAGSAAPVARSGVVRADLHQPAGERREIHRSEEHTSELQSQSNLVCRLLLEKKKKKKKNKTIKKNKIHKK